SSVTAVRPWLDTAIPLWGAWRCPVTLPLTAKLTTSRSNGAEAESPCSAATTVSASRSSAASGAAASTSVLVDAPSPRTGGLKVAVTSASPGSPVTESSTSPLAPPSRTRTTATSTVAPRNSSTEPASSSSAISATVPLGPGPAQAPRSTARKRTTPRRVVTGIARAQRFEETARGIEYMTRGPLPALEDRRREASAHESPTIRDVPRWWHGLRTLRCPRLHLFSWVLCGSALGREGAGGSGYLVKRGSMASRKASPNVLSARTVTVIARLGKIDTQGA